LLAQALALAGQAHHIKTTRPAVFSNYISPPHCSLVSFKVCERPQVPDCVAYTGLGDMAEEAIEVTGARVNNLKNISFSIPINQLTVVTGVSGSGKSSLAFDTIYAEGQRRYVESLSAYARQFLERMDKPDVDEVRGIAPAIAIRQKNSTRNPRSTVGTQTEVYDYLRLLYARVGTTFCRVCGRQVYRDTPQSIADEVLTSLDEGTRFYVLFPAAAVIAAVGREISREVGQGMRIRF